MAANRELRLRRLLEHWLDGVGVLAERLGLGRVAGWAARPLLLPPALGPAPAIVVLCGGCRFNGQLNEATCGRVAHGADLFSRGLSDRLILSGGRPTPYRPNCAVRMKALAERLGVPSERIVVEDRSGRTVENAREVGALLRASGEATALLVTGPLHMRRARRCFERAGVRVACAPVPGLGHGALLAKEVLHEYIGLAYYRLRRWA
jgi:uncharacterized SAM-binding protein YcdF (DUF218 family)